MASTVTPNLSGINSNLNVKTYSYGGSTKSTKTSVSVFDKSEVPNYSFIPTDPQFSHSIGLAEAGEEFVEKVKYYYSDTGIDRISKKAISILNDERTIKAVSWAEKMADTAANFANRVVKRLVKNPKMEKAASIFDDVTKKFTDYDIIKKYQSIVGKENAADKIGSFLKKFRDLSLGGNLEFKETGSEHWYDDLGQKTGAFLLSNATYLTVGFVEPILDSVASGAAIVAAWMPELIGMSQKVSSLANRNDFIGKVFSALQNEETMNRISDRLVEFTKVDATAELYRDAVEVYGLDEQIAYSKIKDYGEIVGTAEAYIVTAFFATPVTPSIMSSRLSGKFRKDSLVNGKDIRDKESIVDSVIAGTAGRGAGKIVAFIARKVISLSLLA